MNAVNSEFNNYLNNDMWREYRLFGLLSENDSPANKFNVGNLDTLRKPKIREALLDFYNRYYSANLMKAVLYGK